MFRLKQQGLSLLLACFCWQGLSAQAEGLGPFEQQLLGYLDDSVLDLPEYQNLQKLARQNLNPHDRHLAKDFMDFMAKQKRFIKITYIYFRQRQKVQLKFVFAPTYSESQTVLGGSSREVLSKISQNDTLPETLSDSHRCGAAALLSAHYLLYGSFDYAFRQLQIDNSALTYKTIHLAQERLYAYANTDQQEGLVSSFRYTYYSDGRVENPVSEGEVARGAKLLAMKSTPLIGPSRDRLTDRRDSVMKLWQSQAVPLLVGVYLDVNTGQVRPPDEGKYKQNHFVLVFPQGGKYWMLNSGVLDNGNGSALIALNTDQVTHFVLKSAGSVQALLPN